MKKCHQSQSSGLATELLQRMMYGIYRQSSQLQRSIKNRVRPAGLVLAVAWLVMACLVLGHVKRSVHELFALSTALGFLALISMASRRARLTARRELPGVTSVGVPLKIPVTVCNRGSRTLRRAWLCESVPDALPSVSEFLTRREPCEDERNAFDRTLAFLRWQWLVEWGRWFSGGRSDDEICLRPGEECQVWIPLTPTRRGRIELADLRVMLPDAFGFFQRFSRVAAARDPWIVLPKCYPVPKLELPGFASRPHQGLCEAGHVAMAGDFVGLRDYQPGDSLRQIHWKSWAKFGKPIVKELEDVHVPRHALLLDRFAGDPEIFEDAVSLAASLLLAFHSRQTPLDLMYLDEAAQVIPAQIDRGSFEVQMRALGCITPSPDARNDAWLRLVVERVNEMESCLVITSEWHADRINELRELQRAGVSPVLMVLGRGSRPPDVPGYWFESGCLARDLMLLPRSLETCFRR